MSKLGVLAEPVLVGRERELEELENFLSLAIEGKGNTIFISGEAGAGKTKLLMEFLKIAEEKGTTVLTGWCLSNAAIPYFPFVEAFDSYFSTNETEAARAINQSLSLKSWLRSTDQFIANEKPAEITPQVWRDQAFTAVSNELLFLSAKKPLIMALEDIHWADSASISLLHYLARQVSSERILIIATFRREELNPDADGRPSQLSRVLHLMGRDDLYKEVALRGLNVANVGRIVENMLNGSAQPEFVKAMAADSNGNPLFVVESLRMLNQQGTIEKKNGRWCICVESIEIPRKFKEVILQRLQTLTPDQRKILEAASVIGEKFNPKLVAAVVSEDSLDVLRAIGEIEKSTLMVHCDGAGYKFEHAKFREMLYKEISPPLKAEYHLRIAEKIEAADKRLAECSVNDLAYHFVRGGNKAKGIIYSLQAGNIALARFSNEEAIKHFLHVKNVTEDDKEHVNERLSALEGLGDAFLANCSFKEATRIFEDLANSTETGVVKARSLRKAMDSALRFGDNLHAVELVKEAEQCAVADRLENARILIYKAKTHAYQNIVKTALGEFKAALKVFEEEYSLWDTASALLELGMTHAILGMPQEGLALSLRSILLFEELGDFRSQSEACFSAGITLNNCLLTREALQMFSRVMEIDDKMKIGDYLQLINANSFSALSLMMTAAGDQEKELACERDEELAGYRKKAMAHLLKALELCKKTDSLTAHASVLSNLILQYTRLGDTKRAEECFEKLMKLPPEIRNQPRVPVTLAKAVFFAGKNKWDESNRYFKNRFEELEGNPIPAGQWGARAQYAWSLERQGRHEEARVQLEESRKIRREAEERFEHVDVRTNLMVPAIVRVGQTFEVRLDIVNVSRGHGLLLRVEDAICPQLKLKNCPEEYKCERFSIDMNEKRFSPFQIVSVKLKLQAIKTGIFQLNPRIVFIDESGKTQECEPMQVMIKAESDPSTIENQKLVSIEVPNESFVNTVVNEKGSAEPTTISEGKFEFANGHAQKAFDYLVNAFVEDYMRRRIVLEKAGWRSLMNIVRGGKLPKSAMYGFRSRKGRALIELERRGIVEARFFPGERGRGGNILKLRVSYGKEIIKRQIDNRIMKKKNQ
jgi:tetratricopeptide (TPR) repeat protein